MTRRAPDSSRPVRPSSTPARRKGIPLTPLAQQMLHDMQLEGGVIRVALEDRPPRIRAVQHVVNQTPVRVSFRSSHVASLPRRRPFVNNGA